MKKKPRLFKSLTGVSVSEFDKLHSDVAPVWAAAERNRLSRLDRHRAIGGGRDYVLDLPEQLLMTLMGLHLSLNTEALGFFFGVDKSTVSRNTRQVLAALEQLDHSNAGWPKPPQRGQGKNIEQALQAYPDLQAIVTEAEQTTGQFPGDVPPNQGHQAGQLPDWTRQPANLIQLLGRTPPFQGLSPLELDEVTQAAHQRQVERQAFFYHQGDPATNFYILIEGQVRLTEVTPEGQQLLVRFVSPGEAFGIIAALEHSVYPLAAQAVEDCRALAWDRAALERLMARFPRLAINGLRLVSQRWHELEERYRELATERVERRVAQTLLRLVRQVGQKVEKGVLIDLPLTRQDLAEMTGATLYTVSRILSRWEQEKLVETGRERVLICYPHGLALIAEDLPPEDPR
ncbi:MAG: cyclic nucleotide-binding domain-containing protein [Chloroflexota bacterium]